MKQPIYFHEDDYCQIELLPASAFEFCRAEMKNIDEFSNAHKDGIGWTDMYIRDKEPQQTLASLEIPVETWNNIGKELAFHSKVTTGYSSYVETFDNCVAWAGENEVAIFVEVNKGAIQRSWLSFDNLTEQGLQNSFDAIRQIAKPDELIIADWNWSRVVEISDAEKLFEYLQSHV